MYQVPFDNYPYVNYYEQTPISYENPMYRSYRNVNYYRLLENTQKTLNTVNQIIPIVTQVVPVIRNAATMFKVAKAVRTMSDSPTIINAETEEIHSESKAMNPTFFS